MILIIMDILYIFLYIAPFSFIGYYLYRERLKVSVKTLCLLYAVIISVQAALFCFLSSKPFWNVNLTQAFRMAFAFFHGFLSFFLIKENLFKQFYTWFLMFAFGSFVFSSANFVEARFFMDFAVSFPHVVVNLIVILQLLILFSFVLKLINKIIIPALYLVDSKVWNIVWLIPALFYAGIFIETWSLEFHIVSSLSYLLIRHFTFWSMVFVNVILLEALRQTAENARLDENVRMTERLLDLEQQHYEMLVQHIESSKRAQHDFRHHLALMKAYLADNNTNTLKKYIEQYQLTLPEEKILTFCKNYAINVVVSYYVELAQQASIDVDIELKLPEKMRVLDCDLCIVFGNILENAIEACKRQKDSKRFITIIGAIAGNNVIITVDNSFEGAIKKSDVVFLSSKREGKGIGITSVQAVAQKYQGVTSFENTGNVFRASVMLTN